MSFYIDQELSKREYYERTLRIMGSLSKLFSESEKPYLDSRVAENVFCMCLEADNLARKDTTADAKKEEIGIGIKTWVGNSMQKIAEFNKLKDEYSGLSGIDLINKISELRNDRIEFTLNAYGLKKMIYHCLVRDKKVIKILEFPLEKIDVNNLKIIKESKKSIQFTDGKSEYSFYFSKSVLMKRFENAESLKKIDIDILESPYNILEKANLVSVYKREVIETDIKNVGALYNICETSKITNPFIYLRLYAYKKGEKVLTNGDGLNKWNAKGRKRHPDEVAIRYSAEDKRKTPGFFPSKDTSFELILPDGTKLTAKVCEAGEKSIQSNPNKDLGKWLLRKVLNVPIEKLVEYSLLEKIGIDCVRIEKVSEKKYKIDFGVIGEYEEFMEDYRNGEAEDIE